MPRVSLALLLVTLQFALLRTGCEETIKATVRKRRLCFAGFFMRMEDNRLPKRVCLGRWRRAKGTEEGRRASLPPTWGTTSWRSV